MDCVITGGRPSGKLHLGHYISAFRSFIDFQNTNNFNPLMIIADVHYLTAFNNKVDIGKILANTFIMMKDAIAMGVDPQKTSIYLQSNISALSKISILFQNYVDIDIATSIYSYRESTKKTINRRNTVGLLSYPIMEAADVFAVGANYVTVGRDNVEHIEMAQKIISYINNEFGSDFPLPMYITDNDRNFIRGIDGNEKMSKSLANVIFIDETSEGVIDKVKKMPWDLESSKNLVLEYLDALVPNTYDKNNICISKSEERIYKDELINAIEKIWEPMRKRRDMLDLSEEQLISYLKTGTAYVNDIVNHRYNILIDTMGLPIL